MYTCRAENVYGSVTCTASVSLLPDWEIAEDFTAPKFVIKPQMSKVMDGQPVTFTCQVCIFSVLLLLLIAPNI